MNGTINPRGATTTYYWTYADGPPPTLAKQTPTHQLKAGYSPDRVSARITGLRPGVSYTIALYASNSRGSRSVSRSPAFKTRVDFQIAVHLQNHEIRIEQPFLMTIQLTGAYDPEAAPRVYIAKAPYGRWVYSGKATPEYHGRFRIDPCPPSSNYIDYCPWLDRNFKVRVQMQSKHTRSWLVLVYPLVSVTARRENNGTSPWLNVRFSATGHRSNHGYPHSTVYFYRGGGRRGPLRRFAAVRLKPHAAHQFEQLVATARLYSPHAAYIFACIRRPLWSDMGRNVFFRRCGSPVLR